MADEISIVVVSADPLARAALGSLLGSDSRCELADVISPMALDRSGLTQPNDSAPLVIIWDSGLQGQPFAPGFFDDFDSPVIVLLGDGELAVEASQAGAEGILARDMNADKLIGAAEAVAAGLLVIDPAFETAIFPSRRQVTGAIAESLTPREMEVTQLLAEGLTNRAIASRLGVSEHTIKFHVNSILSKLNAQSRTEAVVNATRLGLIAL